MLDYVETVCNFLNNLKGYITIDELVILVNYGFDGMLNRTDIEKRITIDDLQRASDFVEEDDHFELFKLVMGLVNKIQSELAKECKNEQN